MSYTRSAHRVRLWVLLGIIGALALGSFWVLEVMRSDADEAMPGLSKNEPDYFVEKFSFVKVSKSGQARYNIFGEKLTHHPHDDSYEILQPSVKALSADQPPMTIRAERARVEQDGSKVHMQEHVRVDRPASGTAQKFHLASEYLLVLPEIDVMQTDKPVVIKFGSATLTGQGLYANQATREFRLANNVHGTYQPPGPQ